MKKRLFGIILAASLIISSLAVYAAPSKTTDDLSRVLDTQGKVFIAEDEAAIGFVDAQADAIRGLLAAGSPLIGYFPAQVQELIISVLPAGHSVQGLELNEIVPLHFVGYSQDDGDVSVSIQFVTPYAAGQLLVPVLGIVQSDGSIQWHVLTCQLVDGVVQITIPQEIANQIGDKLVVLAMLSEKAA